MGNYINDAWERILVDSKPINFEVTVKSLPTKGNLVYEYNPFRNYRLSKNMYEYKNNIFSLEELKEKYYLRIRYTYKGKYIYDLNGISAEEILNVLKTGVWVYKDSVLTDLEQPVLREAGELVDFITDELSVSLEHPVSILPQHSYDGSVNLILNDGLNVPRMINSRFSATGRNTYEIVDRKGNNDTNIYDLGDQFDIDSSLYKRVINIPKIEFKGVLSGGNLKIGNYHFYFKLADADGNETDFVGESGLVSIFIGHSYPSSIHSGTKNENSLKSVHFLLSNIDSAYDNVTIYYSRNTAELGFNRVTEYIKIDKKYKVNNAGYCNISITGFEETIDISVTDINLNYNIVDRATTQAVCQNMLFLANVHKPDIPYNELTDLSLRFLPYLKEETYDLSLNEQYIPQSQSLGYYDPLYIYNKLGYWNKEIYRIGIVYILPNGELSPVFNIRGGNNIKPYSGIDDTLYTNIGVWKTSDSGEKERVYINYNEDTNLIIKDSKSTITLENIKGVIRFDSNKDTSTIYSLDIRVEDDVIQELKKYVKGYFFVRQTRIPTILAQGVTVGIDNESHTPTIPTKGGVIDYIKNENLDKTHLEIEDIDGVNYLSEGFLTRYRFYLKSKNSFLKVFSTITSYAATVCSFVPVWGTVASLALNAASFVTGTIATGKFQVAAFVSTALSAAPYLGAAMSKVATATSKVKFLQKIEEVQKTIKVVEDAANTLKNVKTVVDAGKTITTVGKIIQLANVALSVVSTVDTTKLLASVIKGKEYKGRYTDVPVGYEKKESSDSRILGEEFINRFIIKDPKYNKVQGIICPDYEVNQPYFNQIFTGNEHLIRYTKAQGINYYNYISNNSISNYFTNNERHFYFPSYFDTDTSISYTSKIIGVPDNVKCVGLDNYLYRGRAGEAEEAWRYEYVGKDFSDTKDLIENSDIIRGSYGAYLACSTDKLDPAMIVDIMIPGYSEANIQKYFLLRMDDSSTFNAISERIDIYKDLDNYLVNKQQSIGGNNKSEGYQYNLYRGDCYLCQFTHRINRNFNDPSAPYNDQIVDKNSWRDNYDPNETEKYEQINLGDVNSVQLGMWLTFQLRSSNNLNIRTLDGSNVDETVMVGHPRGYYPYHPMSTEGTFKHPESEIYNKGFTKSISDRWNMELPDVPHIKNWFGTRIMYSDIHINDAYKNGFRVFLGTNYRDYTREYGEIVKLVPFESSLLCIFEHGIALIPVNERAIAGQGAGGNVYINTSNVLPENPKIISDMFGSQWPESVLKVPGRTGDSPQYVYGVDTVAKKIWRTDGNALECISDFRVQEFLNNNITLGERELTPKIGIRNVKTHYNAFKRDVMFTFYDNTYGFEEKVWNLCWNELLLKFITFYSWVPSYMENINNIPFSFNRDTSKWVSKLGTSHTGNSFADGITLSNVILNNTGNITNNYTVYIDYITKNGLKAVYKYNLLEKNNNLTSEELSNLKDKLKTKYPIDTEYANLINSNFIGALSLDNRVLPENSINYYITYSLERDNYQNYKLFTIRCIDYVKITNAKFNYLIPIFGLFLVKGHTVNELFSELYYRNKENHSYSDIETNCYNYINYDELSNPKFLNIEALNKPIYKNLLGKRLNIPRDKALNPDKLVRLLNIKANITVVTLNSSIEVDDYYYNLKAGLENGTTLTDIGYYESVVAITPEWNLLFLSTDFWKHGLAGLIDIADDIYPTYWYGKQHPFEFEVVVVNDPSTHKIFSNLEIVANKAKPESFHYEIVGECYDFAKDKVNMYFRQEAKKALWLYNGSDITYNRNFLKTLPALQAKSADFPYKYYYRQDFINEIEDYYDTITLPLGSEYSYKHLSGAEIVYYPNRLEYRIWQHVPAVNIDDLSQESARSIISANCLYLEDKWRVTINPILICYKNEGKLWKRESSWTSPNKPPLTIKNSPIPNDALEQINQNNQEVMIPDDLWDYGYRYNDIDDSNWIDDIDIYGTNFGEALNRKELDLKDKFIKVRIRYSGEELAVIDFLNTIYRISYA